MTARVFWLRLGAVWTGAAAALALAHPSPPHRPWPAAPAGAAGVAAGSILFLLAARGSPKRPRVAPATAAVLVVWAGAEEVLWRWLALGELAARAGPGSALLATSVGFAAVHRDRRAERAAVGGAFGLVYLAAASLAAAWAAHAAYNLCAATRVEAPP